VKRYLSEAKFAVLTAKAALGGAVIQRDGWSWNVAGPCSKPKALAMHAEGWRTRIGLLSIPCRRCGGCLAKRGAGWARRAAIEFAQANRTWFGTLTFKPDIIDRATQEIIDRLKISAEEFAALPRELRWMHLHGCTRREVTLYLKRVRHLSQFRHVTVCEPHKTGVPHYHLLIHEPADSCLRKADLETTYHAGFSAWRLAKDVRACWYVSKYLMKGTGARVRASRAYGQISPSGITSIVGV